jgi:multidrug efflux pump subunit AcrA (membrane-fusion protein)
MRVRTSLLGTRRRMIAVITALVVAVAAVGGFMYTRGSTAAPQYRTAAAALGTIRQTLSLTGNLAPVAQSNLNFQVSGTVTAIDVSAGQTVSAGQVLATVDPSTLQTTLTQDQANLAAAQAKLTADESSGSTASTNTAQQIASAKTTLANDQTAYNDTIALNNQTISNDQAAIAAAQAAVTTDSAAVSSAQTAYTTDGCGGTTPAPACTTDTQNLSTAKSQQSKDTSTLASAQQALPTDTVRAQQSADQASAKVASDRTALSNAESTTASASQASAVAQDNAGLAQAQQAVTSAQNAVAEATLTAPTAGEVAQVNLSVGSTTSGSSSSAAAASASASASAAQFILLTPGSFEVTSTVSDSVISEVTVGQNAVVTAAGSTNGLAATVTSVGVIATVSSGVATFPVTVQITGSHPSLRDGMSATVVVVVNQVVGVLSVPTSAVHTNGTASFVNVLQGGKLTPVTVTVGSADSLRTQITSGLSAGQTVVIATVTSTIPTTGAAGAGAARRGGAGGLGGGGGAGIVVGGGPAGG